MSLGQFTPLGKLGTGSFSTVMKVRRKKDGKVYALKQVPVTQLTEKDRDSAVNEVRLLASIHHANIISYKEAFIDDTSKTLCVVMEYADAGDLHQKIAERQRSNEYFSEDYIWNLVVQVTQGLKVLHGMGIAHRDLKSANVFLFQDGSIKLGDFNVSKVTGNSMMQTQTGTPYYASPEVWAVRPYDYRTDIWSLGCVIYEACALCPPFRAGDLEGLQRRVTQGVAPALPMVFSHDLQTLVNALLAVDPNRRPSCDVILRSPCVLRRKTARQSPNIMSDSVLLKTIRMPSSLQQLEEKLPKPRYNDMDNSISSRDASSTRLPAITTPFSNLRSESSSPYKLDSRNQSIEQSPDRRLARREYYREGLSRSRAYQDSVLMRGGSRILESVRRSHEVQESLKSRQSHPRQRMFLPSD